VTSFELKAAAQQAEFFRNLPLPHAGMRYWQPGMLERSGERVHRARRVKLAGAVLVLVRLENGRNLRARLHQLSVSGGLLHMEKPVDEGIKVEVMFHVGSTTVRNKARMLFPHWATQGCLQPFEFCDLAEEERHKLQADLHALLGQTELGAAAG
jgi:hypothetical protein